MFKAISAFFSMFYIIFGAGEKFAKSVDNLAGIAEKESAALAAQMEVEREARIKQLRADLKVVAKG